MSKHIFRCRRDHDAHGHTTVLIGLENTEVNNTKCLPQIIGTIFSSGVKGWVSLLVVLLVSSTQAHAASSSADIRAPKLHVNRDQVFPLPPGDWQVVWNTVMDWCKPGAQCKPFLGRAQVIQNRDPSSPIYGIAIRYTDKKTTVDRFLKLCQEQLTRPYKDLHGSDGNAQVRLCSFGIEQPMPLNSSNWWWQMLEEGLWKLKPRGTAQARLMLRMHKVGDQVVEVAVFLAKDAVTPNLTTADIMEWKKAYMAALVDGFYKGRRLDTSAHLALIGSAKPVTVAVNSQPTGAARGTDVPAAQTVAAGPKSPEGDAEAKRLRLLELELQRMKDALAKIQTAPSQATVSVAPKDPKPKPAVVMAPRYALVVGNAKYQNVSALENTLPDAKAFAESLKGLGFNVTLHTDMGQRQFNAAVRQFKRQLKGGEEVVFYYAGHGVQLGSANYLLPVDVGGDSAGQVRDEAIELQKVLDSLAEQKTKFSLAVIDACRDNPFKQNGRAIGGRGLAPTTAATGQMIIFSAGAGQQALDKLGPSDQEKNGLFTRVFLEEMRKPGIPVDQMLRQVRQKVVQMAKDVGHEQVPALYDQAIGQFYFRPQ